MKHLLLTLLLLCPVSLIKAQEVAWVKTFHQSNPANPAINSEQIAVLPDSTFWVSTMPQRNSYYSQDALGDLHIYQMNTNGSLLDSIVVTGEGVVQEVSSFDQEVYFLIGYTNNLTVVGNNYSAGLDFRQILLRINGQGQAQVLWEQPDSTATFCASGPGEYLTVSKQGLTTPHITRLDTLGNILQQRAVPGLGRAYAISQNQGGQIVISGSCLGNSFQLDSISLPSTSFYNGYLMGLSSGFQGIWGNLIPDITCQKIRHRQNDQGSILFGASTTQALTLGNISHQGPNTSGMDFYLVQVDAGGIYQWTQEIPGDTGWSRASIATELGMGFDPVGNVYMTGTANSVIDWGGGQFTASAQGETDAFVISWDGSGNLRWVRNFGLGGRAIPSRIEVLGIDSMLISGVVSDSALFGSNVVPMDFGDEFITLMVPEITTSLYSGTIPQINFYPNPLTDVLYAEGYLDGMDYEICDLHGKVILAGKLERSIPTSSLNSGIYFIVLRNESGEPVQFRKLVK